MFFLDENNLHFVALRLQDELLHAVGRGFTTILFYCNLLESVVTSEVSQSGMIDDEGAMSERPQDLTDFTIDGVDVLHQTVMAMLIELGIGTIYLAESTQHIVSNLLARGG